MEIIAGCAIGGAMISVSTLVGLWFVASALDKLAFALNENIDREYEFKRDSEV